MTLCTIRSYCSCCAPTESCDSSEVISALQIAKNFGYDAKDLEAVPESSILGVGCGAPVSFADIKEGEVVVDIGSGGGFDDNEDNKNSTGIYISVEIIGALLGSLYKIYCRK